MTSEALIIAIAAPPAVRPSSSTASLLIEAVTIWPGAISRRTCAVVAPFFTSRILPLSLLRALSFMSDLAGWRRVKSYNTQFVVGDAMRARGSAIRIAQMTVAHFAAIG